MSQDFNRDPILEKVYTRKKIDNSIIEYSVKEGYGSGKILYYEIYEGVFVIFSDYCIKLINLEGIEFKDDVISMYRIYDGSNVTMVSNSKSIIVKSGDMVSFAGNNSFYESDGYGNHITSVGIFGYYNAVLDMFQHYFENVIMPRNYYDFMKSNESFTICRKDIKFEKIFDELLNCIQSNNLILMKIKALELMEYEMVNYGKHRLEKNKVYDNYYIEKIYEIKEYIDENWEKKISIAELAEKYKINKTYLKEIFKECFNISPHKYIVNLRLEKSKELLKNKEIKIEDIAFMTGFSSSGRYSESFKKNYGYLPSKYRKEN